LGKDIVEKQATKNWGDSIVEQLGKDLQSEFPEIKGFSRRNLFYIKGWYLFYNQEIGKVQQVVAQLCSSSEITSTELVQQAVALINTSSKNISIEKVQQLVGQIPWGYN